VTLCIVGGALSYVENGREKWGVWNSFQRGICHFEESSGFQIGGGTVSLTKIKAPVAVMENKLVGTIFGHLGTANSAADAAIAGAETIKRIKDMAKFAKVAGPLSAVLGVVGVVFGVVADMFSNTPEDAIKATNKALEQLTNEVNQRLDGLKGYVDQEVLRLEKVLNEREYKMEWKRFTSCVRWSPNQARQLRCMEEAEHSSLAKFGSFAIYYDRVSRHQHLTVKELKAIELNILTFRNYAILRLMTLKALMDAHKGKDKNMYNRYVRTLRKDIDRFSLYANKAFEMTKLAHLAGWSCGETAECLTTNIGRLYGYITYECSCKLNHRMMPVTSKEKCDVTVAVRDGHKYPGDSWRRQYETIVDVSGINNGPKAATKAVVALLHYEQTDFRNKLSMAINNYWTGTILSMVPQWQRIKASLPNV